MLHNRVMASLNPEQTEALAALEAVTDEFRAAEEALEEVRERVHKAVLRSLRTGVGPSEIERRGPYDRNHVGRIRKTAGIPGKRS